jgi:3-deoxy-D-manno-octulosonic-acid transferase
MPGVLRLLAPRVRPLRKFADLRRNLFEMLETRLAGMPKPSCRLWVHAASVGEFEQARPIITELKRKKPGLDVVVSFLSDSGYEARKEYPDASLVFLLPLDTPENAQRLVGLLKPDLFMLMRYDFWPNHLEALRRHGTRMVLAAAALPAGSPYFRPILKGFYRDLFALFDRIFTIGEQDRTNFRELFGCRNAVKAGEPRFDQVYERQRRSDRRAARLKPLFAGRTVLVGGSVWEPDEAVLIPAWLPLRTTLDLVLVPHKVDRPTIDRIIEGLRARGIEGITLSSLDSASFDPSRQVLVVDQTGFLAELYAIASIAWVGGAFGVNVHNTIEPAVHGIPVLFGPRYGNSPEAGGLIGAGGGISAGNSGELGRILVRFTEEPDAMRLAGRRAWEFVQSNLGATTRIADALGTELDC